MGHKIKEQIPGGLSQQTMTGPTKGLMKSSRDNMKMDLYVPTADHPPWFAYPGWEIFGIVGGMSGVLWAGMIMGWFLKNIATFQPAQKVD